MKALPLLNEKLFPSPKKDLKMVLFLDYDGTLAPIVRRPELARFPSAGRKSLAGLAKQKGLKIVIISGRLLADVKKRIGLSGISYVGNHGLEMRGPGLHFLHPDALKAKKLLKRLSPRLSQVFQDLKGVWVEDKTFTLTIHYREAGGEEVSIAKRRLLRTLEAELKEGSVVLTEGKKVWEVRPRIAWDKGAAVKWLCRFFEKAAGKKFFPVYVGDDVTDESAFKALKSRGVSVKVTQDLKAVSAAKFFLRTPAEVHLFLKAFGSYLRA